MTTKTVFLIFLMGASDAFAKSSSVSSEDWMGARSVAEMKSLLGQEEKQNTFSQRCRAELRGNYLPLHCYRWLEKSEMKSGAKAYLYNTLEEVCEKRLSDGIAVGEKTLQQTSHLGSKCQKALKSWISVKMYKMNRENTEKLFDRIGTGSVFESVLDNANSESVSQDRIHSPGSSGRRLN